MVNQCIDNAIKELFEHVHAPSLAHGDREILRGRGGGVEGVSEGDGARRHFEEEEENASNAKKKTKKGRR